MLSTPLAQQHDLHSSTGPLFDAISYRQIVGDLQYLTLTRPALTHVINLLCQIFMHKPTEVHYQAVKRILHYVKGTMDYRNRILSQFR